MTTATPGAAVPVAGPPPPMWLIFGLTLTGILGNVLVPPALPDLARDLDVSEGSAALVITAATVPGIVLAPVIGVLADRFGRRRVLIPCLVAFGAFGTLGAVAPNLGVLLALRVGQGFGSAGLINLAVVLIADHWDGPERARRIGLNAAVLTSSLAVLPLVGGTLTSIGGWRLVFVPYALGLVTAAVVTRRLAPVVPSADVGWRDQLRDVPGALAVPEVAVTLGIGVVVFVLLFGLILTVLPFHLDEEFSLSATGIGAMLGIPALASTTVALNLGRLRGRFSSVGLVSTGLALFAVAFAGIGLAPSLVVIGAVGLVFGAGEGLVVPSLQDRVAEGAPPALRGTVIAVWVGAVRLGQAAGPALAGMALGAGVPALFVTGGVVAAVAAVVMRRT